MAQHECVHNKEFNEMKEDIKELKETMNGHGMEPGVKGTLVELNLTMKSVIETSNLNVKAIRETVENQNMAIEKTISNQDKAIKSIMESKNDWEVAMRVRKELEMKVAKRRARTITLISATVAIGGLILGVIQYTEKKVEQKKREHIEKLVESKNIK